MILAACASMQLGVWLGCCQAFGVHQELAWSVLVAHRSASLSIACCDRNKPCAQAFV